MIVKEDSMYSVNMINIQIDFFIIYSLRNYYLLIIHKEIYYSSSSVQIKNTFSFTIYCKIGI